MSAEYERLKKCLSCIREKTDFVPETAIVLGSGLGALADEIDIACEVDYHDIDGFPIPTVSGHRGRFVFGYIGKIPVVIMQGRVHYYEGYSMRDVVLPIRLMRMMGGKILFLTNAAGGVNPSFAAGDFMLIRDQISNFLPSPLIGENVCELGVRFPDMSEIYDKQLSSTVRDAAKELGIPLREGVYVQLSGPNYESPQEVKMCRLLGGDAVGMSTACEAIAAVHCGFKVCGISCITNLACGITDAPLSHKEVSESAARVATLFKKLIPESVIKTANLKG